ncbi:MAG: two-component system LytT family response regulator [Vicingaceae bacterium]|jgi:two-component system LytT family response regulator
MEGRQLIYNPKLNAILIDNNEDALISLRLLLYKHCPNIIIVGESMDNNEGAALIKQLSPDVVFLDINLNQNTGFDLLEQFQSIDFQVIFVTAHKEHSIKALRLEATDYLMKPVSVQELKSAVARAKDKVCRQFLQNDKNYPENLGLKDSRFAIKELVVPEKKIYHTIPITDIIILKAEGSYTRILLSDDRSLICSKNLGYFQELLEPEGFHRVHRKHLVCLSQIDKIIRESRKTFIRLINNEIYEVAYRERKAFFEKLETYNMYGLRTKN